MGTALDYIHNFFEKYLTIPEIYPSDIFEIVIISVLCYYVILWFRKSRAWTLLKGIFMIVIFMVITTIFRLTTLQWIINKTLSAGIIAIVIIFQPELRRALEELGKKNVFFKLFKLGNNLGQDNRRNYKSDSRNGKGKNWSVDGNFKRSRLKPVY